jgi:predicted Rossmann fold nucleotide-binding protein DprA/Smf involved in DNA uptake
VQARVLDALPAQGSRELAELEAATALNARAVLAALDALAAQGRVSLDAGGWRLA